jgi:hypothetical protein
MPDPNFPTPTTVAELQALIDAARPETPRRLQQFALPLADRIPGYLRLGCVRVVITPSLARQLLTRAIGPVEFGGPVPSGAAWAEPQWARGYRIKRMENVARLARIILSGQWNPDMLSAHVPLTTLPVCGEPLGLSRDGILGHGAHRLAAVDLVDLPIVDDFLAQ